MRFHTCLVFMNPLQIRSRLCSKQVQNAIISYKNQTRKGVVFIVITSFNKIACSNQHFIGPPLQRTLNSSKYSTKLETSHRALRLEGMKSELCCANWLTNNAAQMSSEKLQSSKSRLIFTIIEQMTFHLTRIRLHKC